MAALQIPALFLCTWVAFLLISPSHSLTCTSQNFTNNKLYANCVDLPSLGAYLHWTHDAAKSSLSVAFLAPPAKTDGWIAWAINPTATGMVGAQSLIAFKQSNGSVAVRTYNISSYGPISESKIAFQVSGAGAEYSDGMMRIFATLALPANTVAVNQVWQVGGSVTGGVPAKHDMEAANLNAKGKLDLVKSTTGSNNGTTTAATPTGGKSGVSRIGISSFGIYVLSFIASLVIFS